MIKNKILVVFEDFLVNGFVMINIYLEVYVLCSFD